VLGFERFLDRYGDVPFPDLARLMTCSACGSRKVDGTAVFAGALIEKSPAGEGGAKLKSIIRRRHRNTHHGVIIPAQVRYGPTPGIIQRLPHACLSQFGLPFRVIARIALPSNHNRRSTQSGATFRRR
jgi:hypothetical protein